MSPVRTTILCAGLALGAVGHVAAEDQLFHAEAINVISTASTNGDASGNGARIMHFDAFGQTFEFQLSSAKASLVGDADHPDLRHVQLLKGSLIGKANSWARVNIERGQMNGVFHDGDELYYIESIASIASAAPPALQEELEQSGASLAVYKASDLVTDGTCATPHADHRHDAHDRSLADAYAETRDLFAESELATREIKMLMVYDEALDQFTRANGSNPTANIAAHMNIADGVFDPQVNVELRITGFEKIPGSDTGGIDAGTYLSQFRSYMSGRTNPGLAHLFTGRDLNGGVIGIAYLNAICSSSIGVGVTEVGKPGRLPRTGGLIAAHEFGHNFGAPHDNQGGVCGSTPGTFLMNPYINGSDQFSPCSLSQISSTIASRGSCIVPIDGGNNAPVLGSIGDQSGKVGDEYRLRATARDADGDSLTFSAQGLPDGLRISNNGSISGTPTAAGTFRSTVTVSDGTDSDSESFNFEVDERENVTKVSLRSAVVSEDAGTATVIVALSQALTTEAKVSIATRAGTATPGSDYYGFFQTLRFAPGERVKRVPVTILDDTASEGTETINLTLSKPMGTRIGYQFGTISINDDD